MDRFKILKEDSGEKPHYAPVEKKEEKKHHRSAGIPASNIQALVERNARWAEMTGADYGANLRDVVESTGLQGTRIISTTVAPDPPSESEADIRMMHGIDLRNHGQI